MRLRGYCAKIVAPAMRFAYSGCEQADVWELFHKNSKNVALQASLADDQIIAMIEQMWKSFPYPSSREVALPKSLETLGKLSGEVIRKRSSCGKFVSSKLALD